MTKREFYMTLASAIGIMVTTCMGATLYLDGQTNRRIIAHDALKTHEGAATKEDLSELKQDTREALNVLRTDNRGLIATVGVIQQQVSSIGTSVDYIVQRLNNGRDQRSDAK